MLFKKKNISIIKYEVYNCYLLQNQNGETIELDSKDGLKYWLERRTDILHIFNLKNKGIKNYNFWYLNELPLEKSY